MVLHVMKWDIQSDKIDAYREWASTAVKRLLGVPGIIEFRGYRPATGSSQVVTTYEFSDFESWAAWYSSEEMQELTIERRAFTMNEISELWGPSPIVPEPIRPE